MKNNYFKLAMTSIAVAAFAVICPQASAGFINGDFETGTFAGWTQTGGTFLGGSSYPGSYTFDGTNRDAIVTSGADPILQSLGVTAAQFNRVYAGNFSARIEDSNTGARFSQISQQAVWNDTSINFAYATVFQDPGHADNQNPHIRVVLEDVTTNTVLYNQYYDSNNVPLSVKHDLGSVIYTDWQVITLDTSAYVGDTLRLTVLASDCSLTGHFGYAYVDGFGAVIPVGNAPEPTSFAMLFMAGLGMAGYSWRKRKPKVMSV